MFSTPNNTRKERALRRVAGTADLAIEFATLGEYRVFVDPVEPAAVAPDLWGPALEWTTPVRPGRAECRLPRIHDRGASLAIAA